MVHNIETLDIIEVSEIIAEIKKQCKGRLSVVQRDLMDAIKTYHYSVIVHKGDSFILNTLFELLQSTTMFKVQLPEKFNQSKYDYSNSEFLRLGELSTKRELTTIEQEQRQQAFEEQIKQSKLMRSKLEKQIQSYKLSDE